MTGRVETAGGKVYELPALLEWRLRRTGGVPCDSFRVKCLYSAEMGEVLKAAYRFAATENGVTRFRGVIDEWSAVCGAEGTVLTVEGRGMAALLLDNEAEAVTYQRAALSEILKDHAAACGVTWEPRGEVYGTGEYAVASGSSRWKAIEGFARRCGLTPYFTREGVLCLRGAAEGRRLVLEEPEGVIEAVDQAVITSGGYQRYFEQDGEIYWHILDPATGAPAHSGVISATAVGDSGTMCDALSTALFVMGADRAEDYWRTYGGFDYLLVTEDGKIILTEGLADRFEPLGTWESSSVTVVKK